MTRWRRGDDREGRKVQRARAFSWREKSVRLELGLAGRKKERKYSYSAIRRRMDPRGGSERNKVLPRKQRNDPRRRLGKCKGKCKVSSNTRYTLTVKGEGASLGDTKKDPK